MKFLLGLGIFVIYFTTVWAQQQPFVVYGPDDRRDIYEYKSALIEQLANATAAMVEKQYIKWNREQNQFLIDTTPYGETQRLCTSERFWNQPSAATCTGFLVGPKYIATAGHCSSSIDCKNSFWVFGYRLQNPDQLPKAIDKQNVYRCKQVVSRQDKNGKDFAVIELDRVVDGAPALKLSRKPALVGESLFVIGHPDGLPTKLAANAKVRLWDPSGNFFNANLDTFGGNSGSPVFSENSFEVVGLLSRGDTDFVKDGNCYRVKKCTNSGCEGERVTSILMLDSILSQLK